MEESEASRPQDVGVCEHGNAPVACPICSAKSAEVVEQSEELPPELKSRLAGIWTELILGTDEAPPDVTAQSNAEFRQWLFESVMAEAKKLLVEWGVDAHADHVEKIRSEREPRARTDLQREYLGLIAEEIHALRDRLAPGEPKWDSWPSDMRANRRMNCVGSTLLVTTLLQRAGIEHFVGKPVGHSLPIARLDNGEWWYLDALNGRSQVRKVEPKELRLVGVRTLEIHDPVIDYRIVPIRNPEILARAMVGNLNSLQHEGSEEFTPGDPAAEQARAFLEQHRDTIGDFSFEGLDDRLDPSGQAVRESPEMGEEKARLDVLYDKLYDGASREYVAGLPPEQRNAVLQEAKTRAADVHAFLHGDNGALQGAAAELVTYCQRLRDGLQLMQQKHPSLFDEYIERLVARLRA